ncbi:MAG: potassium transporter TrkA [Sandaracinus sp.]|nr:potassium transporter TrkA [Sandaracinus sp.]
MPKNLRSDLKTAAEARSRAMARLLSASIFLSVSVAVGTTAYFQIGHGRWTLFDCLYMTVITLSTVGFGETLEGMAAVPEARMVTMILIVVGSGTLLYFLSNFMALIVEGDLQGILRQRRMQRHIEALEDHIIVCGAGSTGEHVVAELVDADVPFVVIDIDEERVQTLADDYKAEILYIIGDATDDHSLEGAGIAKARGVISCLHTDKDNLFVTISARDLTSNRPGKAPLRIVTKAVDSSSMRKMERAGASAIVSPNQIGGLRLVSEMIRPRAIEFLDRLLRADRRLRIEDVTIPEGSNLDGRTLADAAIRQTGALVIAVRQTDGTFVYNPGGSLQLQAGASLIVIAHTEDLQRLRDGLANGTLLVARGVSMAPSSSGSQSAPPAGGGAHKKK